MTAIEAGYAGHAATETCELCIIGAGIAGLNALAVAAEYLSPGDRVVLIDRNPRCGGMWNTAYDYVRLHQPHPMFTAGDIPWAWKKPRNHLAARTEVQDHLAHCFNELSGKLDLLARFGHDVLSTEEISTRDGPRARVRYKPVDGSGRPRTLEARRLINAIGLDIPRLAPLPLSSGAVRSVTPEELDLSADAAPDTAPVFIVGAGKTGMDTVLAVSRRFPGRQITLIGGQGTVFANRDIFMPDGARRWWRGQLLIRTFKDVALRFDGDNEEEVFSYFRDTYCISPDGTGEQFLFGLLSTAERDEIAAALAENVKGYLADVADGAEGPELVLRDGTRRPVAPGSLFVNCTGHVLRAEAPFAPYLSRSGTTLTISTRSAVHFLSSVTAYFLSHLFFLDRLQDAPLYALDLQALMREGRKVWHISTVAHTYLNTIVFIQTLPFKVVDGCGLDLDRWYPLPRRAAGLIDIKLNQRRYTAHCRAVLDRVVARTGVTSGPLRAGL